MIRLLATVITNLLSAIPWLGKSLVEFVWGGFSVSSATINRFFSLHFTLPFILAALVVGHLLYLHVSGSSNPVGTTSNADRTAFHPYFSFKDLVTLYLFFIIFTTIVFYAPDKLGRRMAIFPRKNFNTIRLNKMIVFCTQVINVIYVKLLYLVKIINTLICYINILISQKLYNILNYKGSSETRCVNSCKDLHVFLLFIFYLLKYEKKDMNETNLLILSSNNKIDSFPGECHKVESNNFINNNNDINFIYWLAGLIDGDGSLLVNLNKALTCEVTVHERDVKALFKIKEKYHGSVLKRSSVKAYRWRVSKKWIITKLYSDLNGKLITDGKLKQMKNFSSVLNIEPIIVNNYNFDINTAWLSGFIDADGCFTIRNKYTLTISISKKTSGILYSIKEKLNCGNVYYDKHGKTFNYAITDLKGIKRMLLYLEKYPLKTIKYSEFLIFRKLVQYIELKYHYQNNPNKLKIDNLLKLFKKRNKV